MNKEELLKLRTKYNEKIKERDELIKIKETLTELKSSNEKIKKILSDEDIIKSVMSEVLIKSLNNIYIYRGTYSYNGTPFYGYTTSQNKYYHLYANIEQENDIETILPDEKEQFEKNKIIIKLNDSLFATDIYYKIRQFYFSELIQGSTETDTLQKIKEKSQYFKIKEIKNYNVQK